MRMIDLNCDMGESFGAWKMGDDEAILPFISSANVACGFHGGDPRTMDRTVALAKHQGVGVGAHPSFPDLVGFGRRNMQMSYHDVLTDILYQIGALSAFCHQHDVVLQHVKPHGQLNNMAMHSEEMAAAIVDGVLAFDSGLILITYGGALEAVATRRGLTVAREAYADRAYHQDGRLVSRSTPGAVITSLNQVVDRAIRMVVDGTIETVEGEVLTVRPDTICIHGDTPGARQLAEAVRDGLERHQILVRPLKAVIDARISSPG